MFDLFPEAVLNLWLAVEVPVGQTVYSIAYEAGLLAKRLAIKAVKFEIEGERYISYNDGLGKPPRCYR